MVRRKESAFASAALLMLLSLTVLYGCRAFEPEVKIINRSPETFLIGAPAETTGGGFTRHLYWYGSDEDGEVVQFIYAITDSTIRDLSRPDRDEEDDRFNPVEDITTLETTDERFVGWTSQTDSVFAFTVDRGSSPSKEITFHMVAVDDRGAIDPTPARLRFMNNSLGNPSILFRVFVDDAGDPDNPQWRLRWEGTFKGPTASSPEQTSKPFVPFATAFRVDWEGSSPNGPMVGYRFKALQEQVQFNPPLNMGEKEWDLSLTSYTYRNNEAPGPGLAPGCETDGDNCPPARVRFPSKQYVTVVEAIDLALVENDPTLDGLLEFEVNYPPTIDIVEDATYPRYELRDTGGAVIAEGPVAAGDTIPAYSTILFKLTGYDRFSDTLPAGVSDTSFCCDTPLDFDSNLNPGDPGYVPEVRYQSRLVTTRRKIAGESGLNRSTDFTSPEQGDTLSFLVGQLDFTYYARTVDEHRRSADPEVFTFVGGHKPVIRTDLSVPSAGFADTLLVHRSGNTRWGDDPAHDARNEIRYDAVPGQVRYLVPDDRSDCGYRLSTEFVSGSSQQFGVVYKVYFDFVGESDPRDPFSPVRAWSFAVFNDSDPENDIEDGRESRDLSIFSDSPARNVWNWGDEDAIEIWVPITLLFATSPAAVANFNPETSQDAPSAAMGCLLRERIGEMNFKLLARASDKTAASEFPLYSAIRKGQGNLTREVLTEYGRRSELFETTFHMLIGLPDPSNPNSVWVYWPDF